MARHLDSVCQICRREGLKLYLKGARCESPKCAIERRDAPPGMHNRRGKLSEYGVRLREKQKLKRFYGVLENQFRRYFALAGRSPESTGEALLSILERRLDNVVHRLGFSPSRAGARQIVAHGHKLVKLNQQVHPAPIPDFLEITSSEPAEGRLTRLPSRSDVDPRLTKDTELREQLIIEFCSR
jgi:small subunit ribosomal protein S4